MQRRNFTLLIIILAIVVLAVSLFLYYNRGTTTPGGGEEGGTNFFSQFNPFGSGSKNPPSETPTVDVSGYVPPPGEETQATKLKRVSTMPIAGFAPFPKERYMEFPVAPPTPTPPEGEAPAATQTSPASVGTEFVTALRYVDRATGNIYQTFADKIEERKFLDITIPKVYEAFFGNHGESVLMRYLGVDEKTIETFTGTLPKEYLGADTTGSGEFKGSFLPSNILDLSLSPDSTKIFYLFESGNGIVGTTLNFLDNRKTQIFDSAFTEWSPWWGSTKLITLSTKPGYVYGIDSTGGSFTKIFGNINGLTALGSPDGKTILYSNNNLTLYTYDMASGNSTILGVKTLSEKCVWGKASDSVYCAVPKAVPFGTYPDTWYQGEASFPDQLWKVDLKNGNTTLLMDPLTVSSEEEIDGIKLALDEAENYLFRGCGN